MAEYNVGPEILKTFSTGGLIALQMTALRDVVGLAAFNESLGIFLLSLGLLISLQVPTAGKYTDFNCLSACFFVGQVRSVLFKVDAFASTEPRLYPFRIYFIIF